jgi:hypothetical protein
MSEPKAARTARQPAAAPLRRAALRQCLVASVTVAACGGGQRPDASGSDPNHLPEQLAAGSGAAAGPPADTAEGENALGLTRKAKDRKPQDAVLVQTITPPRGFVDTPLTFDAAGGRLLYVNTDAADLCELVVFDLNTKAEVMRVDLKAFTTSPLAVHDVIDGEHFLVLARPAAGVSAAIVDRKGAVSRKFGPATDIVRTQYDGDEAVAVYLREEVPPGKSKRRKAPVVRHTIDLFALATGKRLGKRAVVTTDLDGFSDKLDFKVNHWLSGYTRAVGVKGGEYDRKEDQRSPNVEAWFDVPRATFDRRRRRAHQADADPGAAPQRVDLHRDRARPGRPARVR